MIKNSFTIQIRSLSRVALAAALTLGMAACDMFAYSPYEVRLDEDEQQLNARNIEKILAQNTSPSDTLKFVLTADTQGYYRHNDDLVAHVNRRNDINFVMIGGDITDFGILKEFKLVHESFEKLKVPYLTVIGNHDAISNGQQVYAAMYGDFDYSFTVAGRKFIFLNSNYLEFNKKAPDLTWLEKELQAATDAAHVFVVAHIPPHSGEFGEEKAAAYEEIINKYKVSYSLHGHENNFRNYKLGDVPLLVTGTTKQREYIVFTVAGEQVTFEQVQF